jgi:hypothetical protein
MRIAWLGRRLGGGRWGRRRRWMRADEGAWAGRSFWLARPHRSYRPRRGRQFRTDKSLTTKGLTDCVQLPRIAATLLGSPTAPFAKDHLKPSQPTIPRTVAMGPAAWRQAATGSLAGTVAQRTGAGAAAVRIVSRNITSGAKIQTTSPHGGPGVCASPSPAVHAVTAEKAGLQKISRTDTEALEIGAI